MKKPRPANLTHSLLTRLMNEAKAQNRPFAEILNLYGIERFLYRLSLSPHRDRFVLKGALLMRHWLGLEARPTRDIDLMALADVDEEEITRILTDVMHSDEDDGLRFDSRSLSIEAIRPESQVVGLRARFKGFMDRTVIHFQVDVGIGDAVYPPPVRSSLTTLLNFPEIVIRAYAPSTTVAEKVNAMVILGHANSRVKDFYDIALLADRVEFNGSVLKEAVRASFKQRATSIPPGEPAGLSMDFAADPVAQLRWNAFIRKVGLRGKDEDFRVIVMRVRSLVLPVLQALRLETSFEESWPPGGPWQSKSN